MKKRIRLLVAFMITILLCFSGCAKKDGKYSEVKMDTVASDGFNYEEKGIERPAADMSVNEEEVQEAQSDSTTKSIGNSENQKLIRTVSMGIDTEYFDDTVSELDDLCKQVNGYIGSSDLNNRGYERSYTLEMRIPQERLDEFLRNVSNIGRMKIRYKQESTEDITLDYFDTVEHKKSLEVERDRILELIKEADSLEYVVSLEDKLSELRYQISSYESSLRRMDDKVSYSTVCINIQEVEQIKAEKNATVGERISSGLKRNLTNIKNGFINFGVWFITALPNLIIIGVFVLVGVKVFKKIYKKNNPKDEEKHKE